MQDYIGRSISARTSHGSNLGAKEESLGTGHPGTVCAASLGACSSLGGCARDPWASGKSSYSKSSDTSTCTSTSMGVGVGVAVGVE